MKHTELAHLRHIRGISVPKFFLYEGSLSELKNLQTERIILRSSYIYEDSEEQSYAGIFQSIVVERDDESMILQKIDYLYSDAKKKLHGKSEGFHIMVQEYREIILGGVAFLEDEKIYIEMSRKGSEGVVKGEVEGTLYRQYSLEIETGELRLSEKEKKNLLFVLKKLEKGYQKHLDIEFGVESNGNILIFQVRPITKTIFEQHILGESSNIGENYPGETSVLTYSFVKKLYSDVYRTTAYESGVSYKKITDLAHIFDGLIIRKNNALAYNIVNWYKMLLLFPGDHKKAFDTMIGSNGNIRYIVIDDLKGKLPNFHFTLKYIFRIISKIFTFRRNLRKLERYLESFYKDFASRKLSDISLEGLSIMLMRFMEELSRHWYVTIDNDFLIMKFSKGKSLAEVNGLYSTNQLHFLKKLAEKEISLSTYLEKYGDRFGDELKLENPPFDFEGPEFQGILNTYKHITLPPQIEGRRGLLSFLINNREKFRIFRAKNFGVARKILLEIAVRLEKGKILEKKEDIFHLHLEQVFALIENQSSLMKRENACEIIGEEFHGKVYIMHEFHIPKEKYDIIVAKSFDPGWTVFLGGLKGIIIENGNLLSHISIIARELSLPLLIGAKGATENLHTGDSIKVTKDGKIYVLKEQNYELLG